MNIKAKKSEQRTAKKKNKIKIIDEHRGWNRMFLSLIKRKYARQRQI